MRKQLLHGLLIQNLPVAQSVARYYAIRMLKVCSTVEGQANISVFINPDYETRLHITHTLGIDVHSFLSALDENELARISFRKLYTAIVFKVPHMCFGDSNMFQIESLGLFIFQERLVVIMRNSFPLFEGKSFHHVTTIHDVVLKLLHRAVNRFEDHLRLINESSSEAEAELSEAVNNAKLLKLFSLERSLVFIINAISSNCKVLESLKTNAKRMQLSPRNIRYLERVIVENDQCLKVAQVYSDVLSGLMDSRAAIIGNNLSAVRSFDEIFSTGSDDDEYERRYNSNIYTWIWRFCGWYVRVFCLARP